MTREQKLIFWPALIAGAFILTALTFVSSDSKTSPGPISDSSQFRTVSDKSRTDPPALVAGRNAATAAGQSQLPVPSSGLQQVARFTLYDVGILPREMHVRAGVIGVMIEDLSGGSDGLILERPPDLARPVAVTIGTVQRYASQGRGRGDYKLDPGRYRVFDVSRPGNEATLVVEP